jgi:hypothetical protein
LAAGVPGLPPSTTDPLTATDGGEEADPNATVAFPEISAAAPMSTAKTTMNRDLAAG